MIEVAAHFFCEDVKFKKNEGKDHIWYVAHCEDSHWKENHCKVERIFWMLRFYVW